MSDCVKLIMFYDLVLSKVIFLPEYSFLSIFVFLSPQSYTGMKISLATSKFTLHLKCMEETPWKHEAKA